jgi:hypothetical protein
VAGKEVQIKIYGFNRLMNALRRLAADNPEIGDEPIREFAQEERAALKSESYPPKRPGQRYIRTGQLANRWRVIHEDKGRYQIVNQARGRQGQYYAGYVVGIRQAWMHVKRWWQAHKIIKKAMPRLTEKLTAAYKKIWK